MKSLQEFFKINNKAAIAFSGGVDSVYLLYEAVKSNADVTAYYVKSAFQPEFELEDAKKAAEYIGASMKIIDVDVLSDKDIISNPDNRCYYCKKRIFSQICKAAENDGYQIILDGTNASDKKDERPGIKALEEMKVISPLRECDLTKEKIRELSKKAGLFTWCKPSYACLATRIPAGETITKEKLETTEEAENFLREIGFKDFRVRFMQEAARIQINKDDIELFIEKRQEILDKLKMMYDAVLFDLEVRQ